jgi:hypothetical protein
VRTESNGQARPKADEDENPSSARFHSFCKQLAEALGVPKEFIQERITQALLHDETQLKELCDHLMAASEHYGQAMSLLKDEPLNRPVTIRIGTTNLINMRVLPAVLESVRQKFRAAYPDVQLRFVQTIMDSDDLLFATQPLVGIDAIVACCLDARAGTLSRAELAASLPLRCCLLRQRDAQSPESGSRSLASWESLRGTEMVALATRRKHFDVPWADVESMMESIEEVPTLLEAHARVAASDAWTMSYRELLDDEDEQTLEAIDLPRDVHRQIPLIVAVLPQTRRSKRSRSTSRADSGLGVEKQMALAMLKECLQTAFEQKKKVKRDAEQLTHLLARFPYSYHISDYAPEGEESRRVWFAGRAAVECTSNGNLTGMFTIGSPVGDSLRVRVFGRPISYQDGGVWHLQWRGEDPREESGTTNMVVTMTDLKESPFLLGSWVGRSSWTGGDIRPSGGPFVLHTRPDLTARELRKLVLSRQDHCVPDLRQLSNDLIPIEAEDPTAPPRKPR